ncbi:Gfo/Idh/MocA family oxidoreductase [Candidatus Bipolaricaulota bacterium]|nr:Gfo/Idh/MocA family oxidoreductase [Candidatus Bipolaricaulota bacterium]
MASPRPTGTEKLPALPRGTLGSVTVADGGETAPVSVALVGAGQRGIEVYGDYIFRHPEAARLVAVAEPDPTRRALAVRLHRLPPDRAFTTWEHLLSHERLADALIIATPDRVHVEPALRALALGYHILLEKPIATTRDEVLQLQQAAMESSGSVTVAHVLRYTEFFATIRRLLDEGRIGRLVSIVHIENIGFWHFAHSYVRGNWRRAETASPMILAKACHDFDLIRWFAGRPCRSVSSCGELTYFRPENAPPGATERCTDPCPVEPTCPYSAVEIYVRRFAHRTGWPGSVITGDPRPTARLQALRESPYGRCVFRCDNDVPDHQVVTLEFAGGITATLIVSAFTAENTRTVKLMGTHGEIRGHLGRGEIVTYPFSSGLPLVLHTQGGEGHAGGDEGLMQAFLNRVQLLRTGAEAPAAITSLSDSVDSHLMAFAAEESRRTGRIVHLDR